MCGRYTITADLDGISWRFGAERPDDSFSPSYNAAPTQTLPVVTLEKGRRQVRMMRWGLVPHWAKDTSLGSKLINARIETLAEKPSFRQSLLGKRCIVPADGYYEWQKTGSGKQPMRITASQPDIFGFAGLWDVWSDLAGNILFSFTIITTEPAESVSRIHNRMPFILQPEQEEAWLIGPDSPRSPELNSFLHSLRPRYALRAYPVSPRVNSPHANDPDLIMEL